jgi:phosphoribosylformimino-5-aminoimidazole carboxamide ribotide isomerase
LAQPSLHIIPVLDIQNGLVVRGIAGQRESYRPIVSKLTSSAQPMDVARAFRHHFDLSELYVADLDAIRGKPAALETYRALRTDHFRLWVDAGLRTCADAEPLAQAEVETIVAGLETLAGPEELRRLVDHHGAERVLFSLDLKGGEPLGSRTTWRGTDSWGIAVEAIACGVRWLLLLDMARVGVGQGTGTEELCARVAGECADVRLVAGGGVRDVEDLRRLRECGAWGALVASALHDGQLTRAEIEAL